MRIFIFLFPFFSHPHPVPSPSYCYLANIIYYLSSWSSLFLSRYSSLLSEANGFHVSSLNHLTKDCVDLKQIDCQIFLQQRWVYLRSAETCHLGSIIMMRHLQIPAGQGKENVFAKGKRKRGG